MNHHNPMAAYGQMHTVTDQLGCLGVPTSTQDYLSTTPTANPNLELLGHEDFLLGSVATELQCRKASLGVQGPAQTQIPTRTHPTPA
jgi:hypothetical protein